MHCVLLLAIDLLLLIIANAIAVFLSIDSHLTANALHEILLYCGLTLATSIPALLMTGLNRTLWRFTSLHDCLRVLIAVLMTMAATAVSAGTFSSFHGVSQSLIGLQFLLMTGALIGIRALMRLRHARRCQRRASRTAYERENILVVGVNAITGFLLRCVAETDETRVAVAGVLSENRRHRGRILGSHPVLGRPDEIVQIMHELDIHGVHVNRVVLAKPFDKLTATAQLALLRAKNELSLRIDALDDRLGFGDAAIASKPLTLTMPDDVPWNVIGSNLEARKSYLRWKRLFDIAAGAAVAICVAPLMLLVGALVFFDVGRPIIFWQQRPGALGRPIKVLKFRTMRAARGPDGALLSDSQRLSSVGKFLRRMRLDELPQVYNVVVGEMSMVGPRPLLPVDQSQQFRVRLNLKPGLTGWAQINGGRHLSVDDKAALDLWYAKNASFRLDLRILLSTAHTVLFGERVDQHAVHEAWLALGNPPQGATAERVPEFAARKQPRRWPGPVNLQTEAPSTESARSH
ncbi:sugar transferase [Hyphomicrobium denitrificans]|nr:sugar transferase [Hyphomicrobium denitrificans]